MPTLSIAPPREEQRRESISPLARTVRNRQVAALSAVAGYVDATACVSLMGLFPAHVTGELVSGIVEFSHGELRLGLARLSLLPVFMIAVAVAATVAKLRRKRGQSPLPLLLVLVTSALALFSVTGGVLLLWPLHTELFVMLSGACVVAAMGFQNALMRDSLSGASPTTFMTGNLTQLIIDLVDRFLSRARRDGVFGPTERGTSAARLNSVALSLGAFTSSALLGAVLSLKLGPLSAALPTALTASLAWQTYRRQSAQTVVQSSTRVPERRSMPVQVQESPVSGTRIKVFRPDSAAKKETA